MSADASSRIKQSTPFEERTITTKYQVYSSAGNLPEDEKTLLENARKAMEFAHSPYSDFKVGVAVQLADGEVVMGSNQENAAFGPTNCAERSALFAIGSQGKHQKVRKIAVVGTGRSFQTTSPVTPCGVCRQVIKEFEDLAKVKFIFIMAGNTGEIFRVEGIDSLLPLGFGPSDLNLT